MKTPGKALVLLMGILAGCRHAPQAADTGASSFTVVQAGRAAESKVIVGKVDEEDIRPAAHDTDYRAAVPMKNQPLPVYPTRALKAKAGAATVGVKVTVDAEGKVTDVGPSLLVFNTPGPYAEDFMAAVKQAVGQWRFHPAQIFYLERVEAPGVSYNRVSRSEKVEAQVDLAFSFTASGGVAAR